MAKEVVGIIKLQAPGGAATPAPPIGPALGQHNVNIGQFVSQFNEATKDLNGTPIPVEISVYADRTFSFICKSPPASALLKEAAGVEKGSGVPNKDKVGTVTRDQLRQIAERKLADLSAHDVEAGIEIIAGTARSMGLVVVD
jgi:large subunit ribosomal protein L11